MKKYRNKYRIESMRAQWWDYGWNGAYFITICTKHRAHFFGRIVELQFIASEIGLLAEQIWYEIPNQFEYAALGDFVVMPNHVHGILILNKALETPSPMDIPVETPSPMDILVETPVETPVETRLIASPPSSPPPPPPKKGGITGKKNPMLNDNLSRIIRWYKGRCSFEMKKLRPDFAWQSLFYECIIPNEAAYKRIANYIIKNPTKWKGN